MTTSGGSSCATRRWPRIRRRSPAVHSALGNALHGQGQSADAVESHRKAIELKPDFALAYCNLGIALHGQGKFADAENACRKAIQLKPDYALAYNNLGVTL